MSFILFSRVVRIHFDGEIDDTEGQDIHDRLEELWTDFIERHLSEGVTELDPRLRLEIAE